MSANLRMLLYLEKGSNQNCDFFWLVSIKITFSNMFLCINTEAVVVRKTQLFTTLIALFFSFYTCQRGFEMNIILLGNTDSLSFETFVCVRWNGILCTEYWRLKYFADFCTLETWHKVNTHGLCHVFQTQMKPSFYLTVAAPGIVFNV